MTDILHYELTVAVVTCSGGANAPSSLVKELLAIDSCQGKEVPFSLGVCPLAELVTMIQWMAHLYMEGTNQT